jgi:diguanylate cyclase (GGDEF)-like protein/PAS domain S-box-containing protein
VSTDERYRALVERAPVGIFEMDAAFRVTYVNRRWSEMTGIPLAAALGDGWGAAVADDADVIVAELARAMAAGDEIRIEHQYRRADGSIGWSQVVAHLLYDDGAISGLVGTVIDVTTEHELEEHLRYNEARLNALFEASSDIMAVLEPDGHWHASPAGTRILGYPIGFEIDGGLLALVHPDDLELAGTALGEVMAGTRGKHEPILLRVRHLEGHYCWFECNAENRIEDPTVRGVVIIARDVTERKHAEDAQQEAENRFRAAFERSPLGIALIDLDGRFLSVNPAFCETLGRSETQLVGTDGLALVIPDDRERAVTQNVERVEGRSGMPAEPIGMIHADGRTVWVLADTSMVTDAHGAPSYLIALLTDVTERKKLEERLEYQAYHDPLTHLANRARLRDQLERAWERRSEGRRLGLLFVDLDRFKHVNDTMGHDAGDEVLLLAARRLERAVRAGDAVARFGGDEFVVICEDVGSREEAALIAGRIRESLARSYQVSAGVAEVAASVGVAVDSGEEATVDELLRAADRAAYRAKELGRNRVEIAGRAAPVRAASR